MRRSLLLALIAITLLHAGAQVPGIEVTLEPRAVGPSGLVNVTVALNVGLPQGTHYTVKVEVIDEGTPIRKERSFVSTGTAEVHHFSLTAPSKPGVYPVRVTLSYLNVNVTENASLTVIPTLRDVTQLATSLADLDDKLDKLKAVRLNESELSILLSERAEMAGQFGELVRLLVEGRDPLRAAELYENISSTMEEMNGRIRKLWSLELVVWSVSSSMDSSLKMPTGISVEFWYRLVTASLWVILLLLALFPLYTTGYITLTYYLVSEMEEAESSEVINEANQRALRILGRAFDQIKEVSDPKSMIMTSLASALAAVGLMADNVYAIIGSMLLSPLMGAIVAGAVGLALIDVRRGEVTGLDLFYTGLKVGLEALFLVIGLSWVTSALAGSYVPLQITRELAARGSPNLVDLAIALAAGFAGSVAMMHERAEAALVGSAIAIALVPPAAAVGVSLAMLNPSLFVGSATLVAVNVIALIAAGYISAKFYAIYPVIDRVFHEFMESFSEVSGRVARTSAEVLLRAVGSLIVAVVWFLSLWVKVSVGLLGTKSLGEALKAISRKVAFVLLPIVLSWLFGVVISTNASTLFSIAHDSLLGVIAFVASILPLSLLTPNVVFFLALIASAAFLRLTTLEAVRARETGSWRSRARVLGYAFLFWLASGYILGINRFTHVSAGYTLLVMAFVTVYSNRFLWERRKRIALYAFVIFTFLTLMIHSAAAFESMRAAETLSTGNVMKVVKEIIASYAGVLPEDVNVSLTSRGAEWVLRARIYVSEMRFKRGPVMTPAVVRAAEETVRHALGTDVRLVVEYALIP
ncbi:MAG: DUF389 domain-containing protein [Candidatus Korarchaeota archaeon]|nr:DUF389 domain-containing protein [Candidatus Korarchaeota archaeon]